MTSTLANGMPLSCAQRYRDLGLWTDETHWEMFCAAVERHSRHSGGSSPASPAALDRSRSVSWEELRRGSELASARLAREAGVRAGDNVIVQMPNCVAYLEVIAGIWRLGARPVFALPAHGSTELRHFAEHAPARVLVGPTRPERRGQRTYDALREQMPELQILGVDHKASDPWEAEAAAGELPEVGAAQATDLAFLQLSGGTTGVPKLIPRTHADYLYSVRQSLTVCDLERESVLLVTLPASHNFTMSSPGILGAILVGASIVFAPDTSPFTILPLIEAHRVTHAAMVPPVLLSLLNAPEVAEHDISSLRTLWVGGAKLSATAARRVTPELGCALQQVFGMAEGLVNYTRLDDPEEIITTTQGRPMSPYDEVRIVDDEDQDVAPGQPGHLLTRGPYTIRGYHRVPEINARSFTADGFYRTGDIVEQLPSGHLRVVGRAKDHINRGGEKIAPEPVENVLLQHPAVHDASVVGVADEVLGEKTCAYVIPRPGRAEELQNTTALRAFCRERGLASFAVPDIIRVVEEFPLTGVGKVSKKDQR